MTPAQQRLQKNDFLAKLATLSGGDPDKAEAIIANDKDVAAAASKLGIQTYEARAAASCPVGSKAANAATNANIRLPVSKAVWFRVGRPARPPRPKISTPRARS